MALALLPLKALRFALQALLSCSPAADADGTQQSESKITDFCFPIETNLTLLQFLGLDDAEEESELVKEHEALAALKRINGNEVRL